MSLHQQPKDYFSIYSQLAYNISIKYFLKDIYKCYAILFRTKFTIYFKNVLSQQTGRRHITVLKRQNTVLIAQIMLQTKYQINRTYTSGEICELDKLSSQVRALSPRPCPLILDFFWSSYCICNWMLLS